MHRKKAPVRTAVSAATADAGPWPPRDRRKKEWHRRCEWPILRSMTAEPIQPPGDPGRNPAAIRDMLPAADRADFARFYADALDEARRTWSLRPVDDILEQWRRIAMFSRVPGHADAIRRGLRMLHGEDVPVHPVDLDALRNGS
jgi:hypothetical protein